MIKRLLKPFCIILILSLLVELVVFNLDFFLSRLDDKPSTPIYSHNLSDPDITYKNGYYTITKSRIATLLTDEGNTDLTYVYIDFDCVDKDNYAVQCNVSVSISDEGNSKSYSLPKTTIYSSIEESKYLAIRPYGNVIQMKINIDPDTSYDSYLRLNRIVFNADVPMFFSWVRVLIMIVGFSVLWAIRPASSLYNIKVPENRKRRIISAVCMANIVFFLILALFNTGFYNPGWTHHAQYHKLAVAITEGHVNIFTGYEKLVSTVPNPYDTNLRKTIIDGAYWNVWDLAFFEGKFYVYFGIVPVLIFYLPYYLLTGCPFPTNAGIFMMSCTILLGVFYLMHQIVKQYFSKTPFLMYLVLSFIVGNSVGTIPVLMRPDFYSLPIMCALAFTIWGLGLWFSAARLWKAELTTIAEREGKVSQKTSRQITLKACLGAFFMALTAGCRPQFLVGSFLIFFIFGTCIEKTFRGADKKYVSITRKQFILRTIAIAIPYIIVAAGIMYYNYIRFGSPFDFGANYNLTTNDMTHRGFNLGRFEDGIWMYLFQPPNICMKFPYVYSTAFNSDYMGTTIRESMFGGAFFTQCFALAILAIGLVRKRLKKKKLFGFCVTSVVFAFVVVIADSQMAGILSRYYYDFLWLLLIPTAIVILQLWEQYRLTSVRKIITTFVVVSLVIGLFMNLGIGFQSSNITSYNDYIYNYVKYLFS